MFCVCLVMDSCLVAGDDFSSQAVGQAGGQGYNRENSVQRKVRRPGPDVYSTRLSGTLLGGWWFWRAPAVGVSIYSGLSTCRTLLTVY